MTSIKYYKLKGILNVILFKILNVVFYTLLHRRNKTLTLNILSVYIIDRTNDFSFVCQTRSMLIDSFSPFYILYIMLYIIKEL